MRDGITNYKTMNRILEKIKIWAAIFASLVLSFLLVKYLYPQTGRVAPENLAIKTTLAQSPEMNLSIKGLNVEAIKSSNYLLNLDRNYYEFRMYDAQENIIYSGKILNRYVIPPPDFMPPDKTPEGSVEIPQTLTLYLPYFKDARKIIFFDESGNKKLEISINNLSLPK